MVGKMTCEIPFFSDINSIWSTTYPGLEYSFLPDGETLILHTSVGNYTEEYGNLIEITVADMSVPTLSKSTYILATPGILIYDECSRDLTSGITNDVYIKKIHCKVPSSRNIITDIEIVMQHPITEKHLTYWALGVRHDQNNNIYHTTILTKLYENYAFKDLYNPYGGNVADSSYDNPITLKIDVEPNLSTAKYVTFSCAIPSVSENNTFYDLIKTSVPLITRDVSFVGPNGYFVHGDIYGKRHASDFPIRCEADQEHLRKEESMYSKRVVHVGEAVSRCYGGEYGGSRSLCGITPTSLTFFIRTGFEHNMYEPKDHTVKSYPNWIFPSVLHEDNSTSLRHTKVYLGADIFFERITGYNYPNIVPTIIPPNPLPTGETQEDYNYIPSPEIVRDFLISFIEASKKYGMVQIVEFDERIRGYPCDTGIEKHLILTIAHIDFVNINIEEDVVLYGRAYGGPIQRSFVTMYTESGALKLVSNNIEELYGGGWKYAWCFSGLVNNTDIRTASFLSEVFPSDDTSQEIIIFGIGQHKSGRKVKEANPLGPFSGRDWDDGNSTFNDGAEFILNGLQCDDQRKSCSVRREPIYYGNVQHHIHPECPCSQFPNPCLNDELQERKVIATIKIPIDVLNHDMNIGSDKRIFCEFFATQSNYIIWEGAIQEKTACGGENIILDLIPPSHAQMFRSYTEQSISSFLHTQIIDTYVIELLYEIIGLTCKPIFDMCKTHEKVDMITEMIELITDENIPEEAENITQILTSSNNTFFTSVQYMARYIQGVSCSIIDGNSEKHTTETLALFHQYLNGIGGRVVGVDSSCLLNIYYTLQPISTTDDSLYDIYRCFIHIPAAYRHCPDINSRITILFFGETYTLFTQVIGGSAYYIDKYVSVLDPIEDIELYDCTVQNQSTGVNTGESVNIENNCNLFELMTNSLVVERHTTRNGNVFATCGLPRGRYHSCGGSKIRHAILRAQFYKINPVTGELFQDVRTMSKGYILLGGISSISQPGSQAAYEDWRVMGINEGGDGGSRGFSVTIHSNKEMENPFNLFTVEIPYSFFVEELSEDFDSVAIHCSHILEGSSNWINGRQEFLNEVQMIYRKNIRLDNYITKNSTTLLLDEFDIIAYGADNDYHKIIVNNIGNTESETDDINIDQPKSIINSSEYSIAVIEIIVVCILCGGLLAFTSFLCVFVYTRKRIKNKPIEEEYTMEALRSKQLKKTDYDDNIYEKDSLHHTDSEDGFEPSVVHNRYTAYV